MTIYGQSLRVFKREYDERILKETMQTLNKIEIVVFPISLMMMILYYIFSH